MIAIYLFYSFASGKQAKLAFSDEFKHCEVICYDGDICLLVRLTGEGILFQRINATDLTRLVKNLKIMPDLTALISVDVPIPHTTKWKPFWVRSCNELCRYATGINIGFTFNPKHLYNKLLKYNSVKNYQILHAWRRKDGIIWRRQRQLVCGASNADADRSNECGSSTQSTQLI